ncbi:hypothetical protein SKAU_G00355900 [Synaphobranchus kaupii]|uniref:Uncharacterized protein n=1 Tax=Synaphobranchus kaupii TaxID=118154 RepID=A0A9Q1IGL5_SYNKA|nr:hypothetical protein SKAU_G00355900 [Synaphobranchus kaupii]
MEDSPLVFGRRAPGATPQAFPRWGSPRGAERGMRGRGLWSLLETLRSGSVSTAPLRLPRLKEHGRAAALSPHPYEAAEREYQCDPEAARELLVPNAHREGFAWRPLECACHCLSSAHASAEIESAPRKSGPQTLPPARARIAEPRRAERDGMLFARPAAAHYAKLISDAAGSVAVKRAEEAIGIKRCFSGVPDAALIETRQVLALRLQLWS